MAELWDWVGAMAGIAGDAAELDRGPLAEPCGAGAAGDAAGRGLRCAGRVLWEDMPQLLLVFCMVLSVLNFNEQLNFTHESRRRARKGDSCTRGRALGEAAVPKHLSTVSHGF